MDYSEETPVSGQDNSAVPTSSQDNSRDRSMYACSLQDFIPEQHGSSNKNRPVTHPNNGDLLATATAVLKNQEAARLIKKNPPYRPMPNLPHSSASKPSFIDKHMQETQMYSGYAIQPPHQRDTIDPDILASVLGQKLPIQAQMEAMQYNERMHRDDGHATRYHPLVHQEREAAPVMDGSAVAAATAAAYNPHRHRQHPPVSMTDAMMYQHQVRGHNYRS